MVAITAERLREVLCYDPETGVFKRRVGVQGQVAGIAVGSITAGGYVEIGVDKGRYLAHRLAWLYVHGKWPDRQIDHINRNRADNRLQNLRDVSRAVNQQNQPLMRHSNKSSGILGVSWHQAAQKWMASIKVAGRSKYLGLHETAEAASTTYLAAKRKLHEGCAI